MARSRGRPAPTPRRAPQQTRQASTTSLPARTKQANPPAVQPAQAPSSSQSPGLFGQMASTAAGVAVGSTVGHMVGAGISGMFGGSSSPDAAAATAATEPVQAQSTMCEADAKNFTRCLDDNQGNMQICGWYLDQLKACQNLVKSYNQ